VGELKVDSVVYRWVELEHLALDADDNIVRIYLFTVSTLYFANHSVAGYTSSQTVRYLLLVEEPKASPFTPQP